MRSKNKNYYISLPSHEIYELLLNQVSCKYCKNNEVDFIWYTIDRVKNIWVCNKCYFSKSKSFVCHGINVEYLCNTMNFDNDIKGLLNKSH